ncbi:MAG: hypothetical protein GX993_05615 [Bacteroidales bacterium]|nr:hypothetical protein [Bacteroidales bacterium]
MKKILSILAVAVLFTACNAIEPDNSEGEGRLKISVKGDIVTKAVTDVVGNEATVNNIQIFIFDGEICKYYFDNGTALTKTIDKVQTGTYDLWVVANLGETLSSSVTKSALKTKSLTLAQNASTNGFVMSGERQIEVKASGTESVEITISRLVARARLVKVTNNLASGYGPVKIKYVMLDNVVANQNISGTANITTWSNKMGRNAGVKIDGVTKSEAPESLLGNPTERNIAIGSSDTPAFRFYGYANETTEDSTDITTWSARKTRLVVVAEIQGSTYYYPVTLPSFRRNTAYDILLTIKNLGSDDPETKPVTDAIDATIVVAPWEDGGEITEEI